MKQYAVHFFYGYVDERCWIDIFCVGQVFINSHKALAQTVVQQGPAYQSRPRFKLYHSDYASDGIWTLGSKFDVFVCF